MAKIGGLRWSTDFSFFLLMSFTPTSQHLFRWVHQSGERAGGADRMDWAGSDQDGVGCGLEQTGLDWIIAGIFDGDDERLDDADDLLRTNF
ncbi:hypothetical protein IWX49DRAFT_285646 [Phyllosticta citricarpa]